MQRGQTKNWKMTMKFKQNLLLAPFSFAFHTLPGWLICFQNISRHNRSFMVLLKVGRMVSRRGRLHWKPLRSMDEWMTAVTIAEQLHKNSLRRVLSSSFVNSLSNKRKPTINLQYSNSFPEKMAVCFLSFQKFFDLFHFWSTGIKKNTLLFFVKFFLFKFQSVKRSPKNVNSICFWTHYCKPSISA